MSKAKVAVVRTTPGTVLDDTHRVMNLAGYQDVLDKSLDTALKINISWHFFYPGANTTPWQLEGVIRAMKKDGYSDDLMHGCHNRTVVIDSKLGERENKQVNVIENHGLRNVHLYEGEDWIHIRDAVGELADKLIVLACLVMTVYLDRVPAWFVILLLARELSIISLRAIASTEGLQVTVAQAGKWKTAFQLCGLVGVLVHYEYPVDWGFVQSPINFNHAGMLLLACAMLFSVVSAIQYFHRFAVAASGPGESTDLE